MSASKKPHMNLVVTGHVDNGKSTTVGHLMVDLGVIDQRTIDSFAKESEATGTRYCKRRFCRYSSDYIWGVRSNCCSTSTCIYF